MQKLEKTELRKADCMVGVNCNIFYPIFRQMFNLERVSQSVGFTIRYLIPSTDTASQSKFATFLLSRSFNYKIEQANYLHYYTLNSLSLF